MTKIRIPLLSVLEPMIAYYGHVRGNPTNFKTIVPGYMEHIRKYGIEPGELLDVIEAGCYTFVDRKEHER